MNRRIAIVFAVTASALTYSCNFRPNKKNENTEIEFKKGANPVVYFEIPVNDLERAMEFYSAVFDFTFERSIIDKNEMALFPFKDENRGISGALARGDIYRPTKDGVLIYFNTNDIDRCLQLAIKNGGKLLYPKTSNGDLGYVAEFEDSEGNRIALHQSAESN